VQNIAGRNRADQEALASDSPFGSFLPLTCPEIFQTSRNNLPVAPLLALWITLRMMEVANRFSVLLSFDEDLRCFLRQTKKDEPVVRVLTSKTSVKDVIESCGIPHPEVDLVLSNGIPVAFSYQLVTDTRLEVYSGATDLFPEVRLQGRNVRAFVADGHLGKLVRKLRLLGVDVSYRPDPDDRDLLAAMIRESRALLTRDRLLLMHRIVKNGYFPRSQKSSEQVLEVIRRFGLENALRPFSRCLRCNGLLSNVSKDSVMDQLEPLTRIYYNEFQRCIDCGQTYWPGSHLDKLRCQVQTVLDRLKEI
jgi:uncharacterized protein